MPELLIQLVLGFALLTGVLGWFALMFASLPGAELRRSLSMRLVRGLFYSYPLWVLVPVYQLKYTLVASSVDLLWGIVQCCLCCWSGRYSPFRGGSLNGGNNQKRYQSPRPNRSRRANKAKPEAANDQVLPMAH